MQCLGNRSSWPQGRLDRCSIVSPNRYHASPRLLQAPACALLSFRRQFGWAGGARVKGLGGPSVSAAARWAAGYCVVTAAAHSTLLCAWHSGSESSTHIVIIASGQVRRQESIRVTCPTRIRRVCPAPAGREARPPDRHSSPG